MKAVVSRSIGHIGVEDIPQPIFGEYEVLCDVLAGSICNGTDRNIVNGHPFHDVHYPVVLGHESIGRVKKLGEKVRFLRVGDLITRVVNRLPAGSEFQLRYGALCEQAIAVDWRAMLADGFSESDVAPYRIHQTVHPLINPIAACMLITWRETLAFLLSLKPLKGDRVLIIGSGANALAFAEHARNLHLSVCVIGSEKRRRDFFDVGVVDYVDYKTARINDFVSQCKMFEIIIDAVGATEMTHEFISLAVSGGRYGKYGLEDVETRESDCSLLRNDIVCVDGAIAHDEGSVHEQVAQWYHEGALNPWRYINSRYVFPLHQAREAFESSWRGDVLKSVIDFRL